MRENTHAQAICVCWQKNEGTKKILSVVVEYIYNERLIHVLQDIQIESSFSTLKTVGQ